MSRKELLTLADCVRAVHTLRDRGQAAPTTEEIARHLKASVDAVRPLLVELKARNILRDRVSDDRREWSRR